MNTPTVYYIGDSTVARNNIHTYPQTGMSQALSLYLREDIIIASHAKNGRSTKSFLDEGRLIPIESNIQPGDFLFIQFGHNDEKDDPARHTDPQSTFRENLRIFIDTARSHGAHPLLITPIARRRFDKDGSFLPGSHGAYPDAIHETGNVCSAPVIDLTKVTEQYLAQLGDDESKPLFMWPNDNTHLKPKGAVIMAGFLADGLSKLGPPYADLLVTKDNEK